jgi:hypothetical protein
MPFEPFRVLKPGEIPTRCIGIRTLAVFCAIVAGMGAVAGSAQMTQPPSRPPHPIVLPEANPVPDANDQMMMREKNFLQHNFDAANAERLKQLTEAAQIMETLAMALKAELDTSGGTSPNEIQKAETIEKLARMVKERMKLTISPN